ncbi:MAG: FimB/Mfa2 family fimbrial subunit [Phocaeicola sp.]
MKRKKLNYKYRVYLLAILLVGILNSCQKFEEFEESKPLPTTTLSVSTRSLDADDIPYPVWVYAFSEEGNCIEKQQISSKSDKLKMNLPIGKYQLVALTGVSSGYIFPELPQLSDFISIENGRANEAAMMGRANITLSKQSATLELTLNYVVTAFKASFAGIPPEVSQVSIHISPLYGSLAMNGDYSNGDQSIEIVCQKEEEEEIWGTETLYIFPCSGQKMAFSITFQEKDGVTKTYGYQTTVIPRANHPYVICGNYEDGMFQVEGGIVADGWGETIYIDFDFGPNISPDDNGEDGEGDGGGIHADIPQVGTIWNDCIVVRVSNATSHGANLLLLSLAEWEIYRYQINDYLSDYSVNEIKNWRPPTYDEAGWLSKTINGEVVDKINSDIRARKKGEYLIHNGERYLCNKEGAIYSFMFVEGKVRSVAGDGRTYLLRAVKEYALILP